MDLEDTLKAHGFRLRSRIDGPHDVVTPAYGLVGSIQLYTSLKKQRVPAELIVYEGMPHSISGHWNNVHRMMNELRWWETYLKPVSRVLTSERRSKDCVPGSGGAVGDLRRIGTAGLTLLAQDWRSPSRRPPGEGEPPGPHQTGHEAPSAELDSRRQD